MNKKRPNIRYDYIVRNISQDDTPAYEAFVPAFNSMVFGDTIQELEEGLSLSIDAEIEERERLRLPIPEPDVKKRKFSGKLLLRISPVLHEKMAVEAKVLGKTLNKHIEQKLGQM